MEYIFGIMMIYMSYLSLKNAEDFNITALPSTGHLRFHIQASHRVIKFEPNSNAQSIYFLQYNIDT